jgi:quinol monooxygenase YgiN
MRIDPTLEFTGAIKMEKVRVIARALARDGKADELKALLVKMVKPTRAEDGCIYYELLESNIPGLFYYNELWQSKAHLDAHAASKHFTEILGGGVKELLKEPLEVSFLHEVQ